MEGGDAAWDVAGVPLDGAVGCGVGVGWELADVGCAACGPRWLDAIVEIDQVPSTATAKTIAGRAKYDDVQPWDRQPS